MAEPKDPNDPKGLIRESYRIDGITEPECRSILMDWALSLPDGVSQPEALAAMIAQYAQKAPDHPMSGLLIEGQKVLVPRGRRGGWSARRH